MTVVCSTNSRFAIYAKIHKKATRITAKNIKVLGQVHGEQYLCSIRPFDIQSTSVLTTVLQYISPCAVVSDLQSFIFAKYVKA